MRKYIFFRLAAIMAWISDYSDDAESWLRMMAFPKATRAETTAKIVAILKEKNEILSDLPYVTEDGDNASMWRK